MARTSVLNQTMVYIKKNGRLFINQKDWRFIIIAAVISLLVCSIVGEKMFSTYESTKSGFFAIISAAIWIGIFNSIQSICKEHATIRSEYRSGLHIRAYVMAHVIFDLALCFGQSLILMGICMIYVDFPSKGVIFGSSIPEYFLTLFLIIWGSDIMGIMVSAISATPNVAMTAMPFVLILQLIMSGVLFELNGWASKIANITFSKWGMSALGSIGNLNSPELPLSMSLVFPNVVRLSNVAEYDAIPGNLYRAWGFMLIIMIVSVVISIASLKIKNRTA